MNLLKEFSKLRQRIFGRRCTIRNEDRYEWPMDKPLLDFGHNDFFTIGDSFQGVSILSDSGGGKSSASFSAFLLAFLRHGYGGVFLTSKREDMKHYVELCRRENRLADVVELSPHNGTVFNAFEEEIERSGNGSQVTHNLVEMFEDIAEIGNRKSVSQGGGDNQFFHNAAKQLNRSLIDICLLATGKVEIPMLLRAALSLPTSAEQLQSENWRKCSFAFRLLQLAEKAPKSASRQKDFEAAMDHLLLEWASLADRTRTSILSTVTGMLDALNRGMPRDLMTGNGKRVSPALAQQGKIIIVNLPVLVYGEAGLLVQVLFKHCFQRVQQARITEVSNRPVFLACDEAHLFAVKRDQVFQTIARSTRTATIYSTQSLSNYTAQFGPNSESEVHSLLGNLQLKIFHMQSDVKTLQYVGELVGRSRQFIINASTSNRQSNWIQAMFMQQDCQSSGGVSEVFEYEITPNMLATLRSGGAPHFEVDAIIYRGGVPFAASGKSWRFVTFKQYFAT